MIEEEHALISVRDTKEFAGVLLYGETCPTCAAGLKNGCKNNHAIYLMPSRDG